MDRLNICYRKNGNFIARKVGDEYILVPVQQNVADFQNIFVLNATGTFIWERLDGKSTLAELKDEIAREYFVEPDEAEKDLLEFISYVQIINAISAENASF